MLAVLLGVVALVGAVFAAVAGADPQLFGPGTDQQFAVPKGVCSVTVDAAGGQGGNAPGFVAGNTDPGGKGSHVTATLTVRPGSLLGINVGSKGGDGTMVNGSPGGAGGTNGGGAGGAGGLGEPGAGGGGASDVRQADPSSTCVPCPARRRPTVAPTGLDQRMVVAGGGGGAGGQNITPNPPAPAVNGTGGAGGASPLATPSGNGSNGDLGASGGQAATAPGAATGGTSGSPGANGTTGAGGTGGTDTSSQNASGGGGGGGGGATGGGGGSGASATDATGGGGGGGGSDYVAPTATVVTEQPGTQTGDGQVTIDPNAGSAPACPIVATIRTAG